MGVNRDDPGTVILYNTNNVFSTLQTSQGEFRPAVAGAIPTNALITVGKAGTSSSVSRFNLNGIDVTVAGLLENNPEAQYAPNKRYVSSTAPATLTVNGAVNRAWGSSHSWIEGSLSLVKAGAHTWTLNGTNTYTGATTVQAGTLTLNSAKALGGSTNVVLTGGTIAANASGAFNADGTPTVPDPANGTLSLADGTTQTVDESTAGCIAAEHADDVGLAVG
jgi:autotransporter-associated beta strand protein